MAKTNNLRRLFNYTGERGMHLFCWSIFCFSRSTVVDVYNGHGIDYSLFYSFLPYILREALWIGAGIICLLGFFIRNDKLRISAFCIVALALMQRGAAYLNAFFAYLIPEPPDSEFDAVWGFLLNLALLLILLTTVLLSTDEKEEESAT